MDKAQLLASLKEDTKSIENVFFDAMYYIYAGAKLSKKHTITDSTNCMQFEYKNDIWRVTDTHLRAGDHSSGMICIYDIRYDSEVLVWAMHHFGKYTKKQASFLKYVLGDQYRKRIFVGGRGPVGVAYNSSSYTNIIKDNDFRNFFGVETISTDDEVNHGQLHYRGGLVI